VSIVELTWPYIDRSIESLVRLFEDLDVSGRTWTPPAPDANSVAALVNHTVSNAEDNLLGTVAGTAVAYERQADFDRPEAEPARVRARWHAVRDAFVRRIPDLDDAAVLERVSHPRRGEVTRYEAMLVVARHAAEHLAHAELTRDLYRAAH